jgi:iron complex outermembrane recepter protein
VTVTAFWHGRVKNFYSSISVRFACIFYKNHVNLESCFALAKHLAPAALAKHLAPAALAKHSTAICVTNLNYLAAFLGDSMTTTIYGRKNILFLGIALACAGFAPLAQAQDSTADSEESAPKELDQIVVIGSRRVAPRSSSDTDSVVPVDVLSIAKGVERSPQFDLAQSLQFVAPSFHSTRQTGADGADLIDSAALRGLSSDQTLVLVNGKRRHTTALVNLFGARNRGSTGTDLNTLPLLGIERIEVLRDGAAAQYGSDAIAGVMNIVMKTKPGCEGLLGFGQYSRGDGENYQASAYCGFQAENGGHAAITGEFLDRGKSDRSPGLRTIGDSAVENATISFDGNLPVGDNSGLYVNIGYQTRDAASGAFERTADDIPTRNSALLYPNGFVPIINGDLEDRFFTGGFKTQFGDWYADFSQTYGYNRLDYTISNTLNASIATRNQGRSPTVFDAGGFDFQQLTTNVDFSRYYEGYLQGLNVAFGMEYRKDSYEIFAGEPGSYIDADGDGGGNAGSQGFPGFQPADVVDESRNNIAAYVDLEAAVSDPLTVNGALRFERYSDFGTTVDGKLAAAYRLNDTFIVRGSASTGFRAPSLQQRFFSSTFTDFISGRPVDVVLAPNGGSLASAAGIPELTEEQSKGATIGLTANFDDSSSMTLDIYRTDIDDRVVLTGRFGQDDPSIGAILAARNVGQAQFFVNSVDTKTEGFDLTYNRSDEVGEGTVQTSFAYTYNNTDVQRINLPARFQGRADLQETLLSERERLFLENGAPGSKFVLGFNWDVNRWNTDLKFIYFGQQVLGTFSGTAGGVANAEYDPRLSIDAAITYKITDSIRFSVGAANILDKVPTAQDDLETDNGFIYDSVQFGLNGTSYFARFSARF